MKLENICPSPVETFVYPRNFKDKVPFVSEDCEFTPCGWGKIDGLFYPLGYKIVTEDLKSLGLRKNPNILTFPVGTWVMLPSAKK